MPKNSILDHENRVRSNNDDSDDEQGDSNE